VERLDPRVPHLALDLGARALPMQGQTANTGAIAGTVSDPSGALVAGAALVVKSQATQEEERDLTTDAQGSFSVPFLTPGGYDLTVRVSGFEPLILKGVQVQITEVSRLKIQLKIGGAKEQIAISAEPPLLQTENATLGRVIDQETIVDLSLVDRNYTKILGLTAGTNTNIVDATQLGPEARRSAPMVRVAATRPRPRDL
jgi:Carboxypeptidase regulatory-like domain